MLDLNVAALTSTKLFINLKSSHYWWITKFEWLICFFHSKLCQCENTELDRRSRSYIGSEIMRQIQNVTGEQQLFHSIKLTLISLKNICNIESCKLTFDWLVQHLCHIHQRIFKWKLSRAEWTWCSVTALMCWSGGTVCSQRWERDGRWCRRNSLLFFLFLTV